MKGNVFFSADTARSGALFLARVNNLKLTDIHGGRNKARKKIINTSLGITRNYIQDISMSYFLGELAVYVWLLTCDEKFDNTLPDIVQCSSQEVRKKSIF